MLHIMKMKMKIFSKNFHRIFSEFFSQSETPSSHIADRVRYFCPYIETRPLEL